MVKTSLKGTLLMVVLGGWLSGIALAQEETPPAASWRDKVVTYVQQLDPQVTATVATTTAMALVGLIAWFKIMAHFDAVAQDARGNALAVTAAIAANKALEVALDDEGIELKELFEGQQ